MNTRRWRRMNQRRAFIRLIVFVTFGMVLTAYSVLAFPTNKYQSMLIGKSPPIIVKGDTQSKSPGYKIVIDAGHGGKDPGAEGASGKWEQEYTLLLSEKVYSLLKQDPEFEPYMTRTDDIFIELEDRANKANDLNADALISIHGNTYSDSAISGTESYYYTDNSLTLARDVHEQLLKVTGFRDRGVKQESWKVLTECNVPAILLEVGFLTNPLNEATLLSDDRQNEIAHAIVDGIKNYFNESQL